MGNLKKCWLILSKYRCCFSPRWVQNDFLELRGNWNYFIILYREDRTPRKSRKWYMNNIRLGWKFLYAFNFSRRSPPFPHKPWLLMVLLFWKGWKSQSTAVSLTLRIITRRKPVKACCKRQAFLISLSVLHCSVLVQLGLTYFVPPLQGCA